MNALNQIKEQVSLAWLARTEQERRFLSAGAAVVLLALVYVIFVAPALNGRTQLNKDLPRLRQDAAQMQALALDAAQLAHQPPVQLVPMSKESLTASLGTRSIVPVSLSMTGDYAKLQLKDASFANVVSWLDAQRRENRISVQDATITAVNDVGQVDAVLTLRQANADAGAR
jgi:general secretion pathway protein M